MNQSLHSKLYVTLYVCTCLYLCTFRDLNLDFSVIVILAIGTMQISHSGVLIGDHNMP